MAAVTRSRAVTLRQAATECYWRARAASRPAGQGGDADADARTAASFRARKDLALIALNARGRGWTRLAEAAHLALLQDRGFRGLAGQGGRA